MTPLEALDAKIALVRTVERFGARRLDFPPSTDARTRETVEGVVDVCREVAPFVRRAVPVAWSVECDDAVAFAAESYPLDVVPAPPLALIPDVHLHLFAPRVAHVDDGDAEWRVCGLLTSIVGTVTEGTRLPGIGAWPIGRPFAAIRPDILAPMGLFTAIVGRNTGSFAEMDYQSLSRWLFAAWAFLDQRLTVLAPGHVDRGARRRAAAAAVDPLVHVVTFRRTERRASEPAGVVVDWRCRWFVSGHWRNQYLPSTGRHQPTWISPYIKGPDDRPLRRPAPIVWSATR